jgi:hypothetical protein
MTSASDSDLPIPEGPGSVSGAPNLPPGFTVTFASRYVDTGEVRLHAVMGGNGPPLLLSAKFAVAGTRKLPAETDRYYVEGLSTPDALHGRSGELRWHGWGHDETHRR